MADPIKINLDFRKFSADIAAKMQKIKNPAYLLRPVAIETIPLMTRRIHINGKAADGTDIGRYATSYMKVRAKHRRSEPQNKVVVALTSQLENDWAVTPTGRGYGIGFLTTLSADKARWVEDHFKKKIFSLSEEEQAFVNKRLTELINDAFNK